jgi:hypothetical protein
VVKRLKDRTKKFNYGGIIMFLAGNKTRKKLAKGLKYMEKSHFKAAIKNFEAAVRSGDGSNLERDAAAWWMVNTAKYRREWKKKRFGNANLFWYDSEDNNGRAWSDVDIAAILVTDNTRKMNMYLSKFLGRSTEAIRFQRRYAHGRPLKSWTAESGGRYTRFTQTQFVKDRLGV